MTNNSFLHLQMHSGVVIGVSHLSGIVESENLIFIDDAAKLPVSTDDIFGWRYINGELLPPLPPTESETLQKELAGIETELWQMFQQSQFEAFLNSGVQSVAKAVSKNTDTHKKSLIKKRDKITSHLAKLTAEDVDQS